MDKIFRCLKQQQESIRSERSKAQASLSEVGRYIARCFLLTLHLPYASGLYTLFFFLCCQNGLCSYKGSSSLLYDDALTSFIAVLRSPHFRLCAAFMERCLQNDGFYDEMESIGQSEWKQKKG